MSNPRQSKALCESRGRTWTYKCLLNLSRKKPLPPQASYTRKRRFLRLFCAKDCSNNSVSSGEKACCEQACSKSRRGILLGTTAFSVYRSCPKASAAEPVVPPTRRKPVDVADTLNSQTTEFTLSNGLRFLVHERHTAPIVSCRTYADVGAFDEVDGQTGLAHLLEHMAFKGSSRIGTRDFSKEAPLLEAMDKVFYELREAEAAAGRGSSRARALSRRLAELQSAASELQIPNHFGAILEQEGAVGLNAATSQDATQYFVSLPANKLELWMAMEAERFRDPVFRELYSEKKVVLEERSARINQAPLGRFLEEFQARGLANNYRRPTIGFPEDIRAVGRAEVEAFFRQHYGPQALTIAVVGDVDPAEVQRMAERYFGPWHAPNALAPDQPCAAGPPLPAGPNPGPRELWWRSDAGPLLMDGYFHRAPTRCDSTSLVHDVISDLLYGSRRSRLYREFVATGRALSCSVLPAYPGEKHPSMFVTYAVPAPGESVSRLAADVRAQVEELALRPVGAAELQSVKKLYRVDALQSVALNSALASTLLSAQVLSGDWRNAGRELEILDALSPEDVRRCAEEIFDPGNRFSGYVLPSAEGLAEGQAFANSVGG